MSALFEIITWTLTITALSGNSFVIFLILFRKNLRLRKLNWYIISLAVADALVALSFYPPLFFCDRWSFCQTSIMRAFRWIFIYSSVCNLCAMTADRYLAITKPMYHRVKVSDRIVAISIAISWLFPIILRGVVFTPLYYLHKREAFKYFLPVIVIIFEVLPCLLILFAALRISIVAKREQTKHKKRSKGKAKKENQREGSRALKMILMVTFLFVFCYALEAYYTMCKNVLKLCDDTEIIQMIRRLMLIANSAINPFVYTFLRRDIKEEVKKLKLSCRKEKHFTRHETVIDSTTPSPERETR